MDPRERTGFPKERERERENNRLGIESERELAFSEVEVCARAGELCIYGVFRVGYMRDGCIGTVVMEVCADDLDSNHILCNQ